MSQAEQKLPKRSRIAKNKKWTEAEEQQILDYLKDTIANNKSIEKPTAKVFYTKFLELHPNFLNVPVNVVLNKSKNLKSSYLKARNWLTHTGAGVTDERSIIEYLHSICPHYDILDEIYSDRPNIQPRYLIDDDYIISTEKKGAIDDELEMFEERLEEDSEIENANDEIAAEKDVSLSILPSTTVMNTIPSSETSRAKLQKKKRPLFERNSINKLHQVQEQRTKIEEKRLQLEEKKFEIQNQRETARFKNERKTNKLRLAIEAKKLELEKIKIDNAKEIENKRIEMEERLKRYELQLMYGLQPEGDGNT